MNENTLFVILVEKTVKASGCHVFILLILHRCSLKPSETYNNYRQSVNPEYSDILK